MTAPTRAYIGRASSPAGEIIFAVNESDELLMTRFEEGQYPTAISGELESRGYVPANDRVRTARIARELEEYAAGERREFDVDLAFDGTEWQIRVWNALRRIPFGETRTYSEIAETIGRPKAARAVGRANATNRIPLVVPCHRVVGADGRLTGFAGGVHLKERLLAHERRISGVSEGGGE